MFSSEAIWNQFAPWVTVSPVLNCTVGMPACSQASSRATPQGSSGGTSRSFTGPSRPWWSPSPLLFSSRTSSGKHSSALQPSQPIETHWSRSSAGVQKAMQELCDEQPPSTLARAWRMNELPRSWGSIG